MSEPRYRKAATQRAPAALARHALSDMGVTGAEERAYRALLRHPGQAVGHFAAKLDSTPRRMTSLLHALETKGLVTHTPDRSPRYFAVPPDIAVEALIAAQRRDMDDRQRRVRAAVAQLDAAEAKSAQQRAHAADERLLEILRPEAAAQQFFHLHRTVRTELLCLARPPMLLTRMDEPDYPLLDTLARGVRCRTLIDDELLPDWLDHLRDNAARGEHIRIAARLPFKMLIADRCAAILPLNLARPDGPVLMVRSSSLLEALCELFDLLWRHATPLGTDNAKATASARAASEPLLSLLAFGLNDKAIESRLDISHRTLARRIRELMKEFGASTRCQLGWLAAHRVAGTNPPTQ